MKLSVKLQEFKDTISDQEKKIITAAWHHWIEEGCYISESHLKLKTEDPDGVERLLDESSHLLWRESYSKKDDDRRPGPFVRAGLLGLMCLSTEWEDLAAFLSGVIRVAVEKYSIDPDIRKIDLDQVIDVQTLSEARKRMFIETTDLIEGWRAICQREPSGWTLRFNDDLCRIALKMDKPDDYLTRKLELLVEHSKETEDRQIALNYCAGRVFARIEDLIERQIPGSVNLVRSMEESLETTNPEDWSNAVHSCRKLLEQLADRVSPATTEPRITPDGKEIKLGPQNSLNRLLCFIEDSCVSGTPERLLSSKFRLIDERLKAVHSASSKGTHTTINSLEEADSIVLNTVLLVGGILDLIRE